MRFVSCVIAAVVLLCPAVAYGQSTAPYPALRAGPFAGVGGGGPLGAVVLGVQGGLLLTHLFAATAETSRWTHGNGVCNARIPNRCDGDATVVLAGLSITPFGKARIQPHLDVLAGRYTFSGFLHYDVNQDPQQLGAGRKPAFALEAGVRARIIGGLGAKLGLRWLRAFDDDEYNEVFGERLRYTMSILGLEYRTAW